MLGCLTVVVVVVAVVATVTLASGWLYRFRSGWAVTSASLEGKTVIVTGASAGIGKEAARDFARRGARVIMACRNLKKASKVKDDIVASTGSTKVVVRQLDTSSLVSVRNFASLIVAEESRLDVLVLNAGIGGTAEKTTTSEGLELTMATNHFGHFLLANMLLGLLKASRPSRVVVVASMGHSVIKSLNVEDLNFKKEGTFQSFQSYCQSKACNILFARHLATLVKDDGVVVNSMCPGLVATEIFEKCGGFILGNTHIVAPFIGKTEEQGAQTIIHLAVSEEVANTTGQYFKDCKVSNKATQLVLDDGLAKKVWEASETCVDLQPEERHI